MNLAIAWCVLPLSEIVAWSSISSKAASNPGRTSRVPVNCRPKVAICTASSCSVPYEKRSSVGIGFLSVRVVHRSTGNATERAGSVSCQSPFQRHLRDSSRSRSYSITRSARTRIDGGIVKPSALAVFMLITSSNFVGNSTGRSPGLAPLRILSTKYASRQEGIGQVRAVAHEIAPLGKLRPARNRRNAILDRDRGNPLAVAHHRRVGKRDHGLAAHLRNGGKRFVRSAWPANGSKGPNQAPPHDRFPWLRGFPFAFRVAIRPPLLSLSQEMVLVA